MELNAIQIHTGHREILRSPTGMHPGVSNGRRHSPKTNTCANRSSRRLERALAGIEKHLERHPRDAMSVARVAAIKMELASFSKKRSA